MSEVPFDCQKAWDYIDEIYKDTDSPRLKDYIEATGLESFGPPIEDEMSRLFKLLLNLVRPKRILEIGMSIGFSTTTLALAAKRFDGIVTTVEIDESMVEVARKAFEREGVSDNIEIIVGDAIEVLAEMKSKTFDVVFQDSTKRGYPVMLEDCIRVLKKGGLFLVDDTLWPPIKPPDEWNDSYKAIDKFNRELLKFNVESTILPIGEGCTIAVKL
ncbi:MAG: O-methyltransferase [Candidatus Thorarchaeota archaeon]|nr:MAG: O-methyltransferase [Candidatus Thorarchaeota archaeon]